MYIKVLDENLSEVERLSFKETKNINEFKKVNSVYEIDDSNKEFMNNLDFFIGVFHPVENLNDFYISFLNNSFFKYSSMKLENIQGTYFSDTFEINPEESILIQKLDQVYTTGESQKVIFEFYKNDLLSRRFSIKIFKYNGFIYLLSRHTDDYALLFTDYENILDNEINPIVIIQDGHFIRCNNKYLELYGHKSYDDVIGQKIGYTGLVGDSIDEINNIIKKVINQRTSYTFPFKINKDDTLFQCLKITYKYIVYDNKPAVLGIFEDLTKQELNKVERDKKVQEALVLEENLDLIQSASDTAFTYYFDDGTIRLSEKLYDLLERKPLKDDTTRDLIWDFVIDEDRHIVEENYAKIENGETDIDFIIRINTAKGNLKYIHCYLRIRFDHNIKKRLSYYRDVTDEQLYLKDLKKALDGLLVLEKNLNRIQTVSKTAIAYVDEAGHPTWTPEIFNILEIDPENYTGDKTNIIENFLSKEDLKIRRNIIKSLSPKDTERTFTQKVKTEKGNIKYIRTYYYKDYDKEGNYIQSISFNQDITSEHEYEDQLETTLNDKKILLSEVHHRVKNNLQIILSLINLNRYYKKDANIILDDTQNRIYAMALIHEKIYGSNSLSEVNMKDYVESLVSSLLDIYESKIKYHQDIESLDLNMEEAIPLGLMINELVSNTIKYAFADDEEGNLYIKFKKNNKKYLLTFEDDGIGFPEDLDLDNLTSLGLIVVTNLVQQIDGKIEIIKNCEGAGFKIEFEVE